MKRAAIIRQQVLDTMRPLPHTRIRLPDNGHGRRRATRHDHAHIRASKDIRSSSLFASPAGFKELPIDEDCTIKGNSSLLDIINLLIITVKSVLFL